MMSGALGPAWLLALVLAAAAPPESEGDRPEVQITVHPIHYQEATPDVDLQFYVQGSTNLPPGARLRVELRLGEGQPLRLFGPVVDGAFRCELARGGRRLLPGVYRVDVSFFVEDQSLRIDAYMALMAGGFKLLAGSQVLTVGDPQEAPAALAATRARLLEILELQGQTYRALADWYTATSQDAILSAMDHQGSTPADQKRRLLLRIQHFSQEVWPTVFKRSMQAFPRVQAELAYLPFPALEEHLAAFPALFDRGYRLGLGVLLALLGEPVSPEMSDPGKLSWKEIAKLIDDHALAAIKALDAPDLGWGLARRIGQEDGYVDGHTYFSKVAPFRVSRPEQGWVFQEAGRDQLVRIRMRPADEPRHGQAVAGVEIKEFPSAYDEEELARRLLAALERRWPSFQKIRATPLKLSDKTMPQGLRHGLEIIFTAERDGKKFKIRAYEMFGRYLKQSYGVIALAEEDRFEDSEAEFDEIIKGFAVLD